MQNDSPLKRKIDELRKFNENHDEQGRFAEGPGGEVGPTRQGVDYPRGVPDFEYEEGGRYYQGERGGGADRANPGGNHPDVVAARAKFHEELRARHNKEEMEQYQRHIEEGQASKEKYAAEYGKDPRYDLEARDEYQKHPDTIALDARHKQENIDLENRQSAERKAHGMKEPGLDVDGADRGMEGRAKERKHIDHPLKQEIKAAGKKNKGQFVDRLGRNKHDYENKLGEDGLPKDMPAEAKAKHYQQVAEAQLDRDYNDNKLSDEDFKSKYGFTRDEHYDRKNLGR